jgi:hypothetical protein
LDGTRRSIGAGRPFHGIKPPIRLILINGTPCDGACEGASCEANERSSRTPADNLTCQRTGGSTDSSALLGVITRIGAGKTEEPNCENQ